MYKKYTLCIIYMECSSVHVGRYLIHYIPCWTYLHLLSWVWCVIMANESNYFSLLTDISFSTKYLRLVHSVIHCLFLRRNFDLQNFIHRNLLFSSVKNVKLATVDGSQLSFVRALMTCVSKFLRTFLLYSP